METSRQGVLFFAPFGASRGLLRFGGFFFLRCEVLFNSFLSQMRKISQFQRVLWGGNFHLKGPDGTPVPAISGAPITVSVGFPGFVGVWRIAVRPGYAAPRRYRKFDRFIPLCGIKNGINFNVIRYFKGIIGFYQLIINHLVIQFGAFWRIGFACREVSVARRNAPLFLSRRQGGRGCEFPAAPFSAKWVSLLKNIIKRGSYERN